MKDLGLGSLFAHHADWVLIEEGILDPQANMVPSMRYS